MKRILIISIIINCLAWMGGGNAAWAQTLPSSGTWGTTTVSSQTVNLDGDVTITGQITIPKDVTLTIQLDADVNKDIKLKYKTMSLHCMGKAPRGLARVLETSQLIEWYLFTV